MLKKSKKGLSLLYDWPQIMGILFFMFTLLTSLSVENRNFSLTIIALIGILTGRFMYEKKIRGGLFPYYIITFGGILGYMVGVFFMFNSVGMAVAVFFLFYITVKLSMYAHQKGYIR